MTRRIVVTGTDTDIGKTVVAAGLTLLLEADYWKPVQAGTDGGTDRERVPRLASLPPERALPEAYVLAKPCSPHASARAERIVIDANRLVAPATVRPLVIEGAGGVLVPITDDLLFADLFARWQFPVVVVASTKLGTINHSLLTIEALRARSVSVLGIVFVGDGNEETETSIVRMGRVKRLGRLPMLDPLNADSLRTAMHRHFRVEDFL